MGKSEAGLWREGIKEAARSKSAMITAHIAGSARHFSLREACSPFSQSHGGIKEKPIFVQDRKSIFLPKAEKLKLATGI